jgi:hypothetical protein
LSRTTPIILRRLLFAALLGLAGAAAADVDVDKYTSAGLLRVNVTNLGYIGHAFSYPGLPAGEYPPFSHVEHIYRGGLWIGARNVEGQYRVSCGSQDANGLVEGDVVREFEAYSGSETQYRTQVWSSDPQAPNYDPRAIANQQLNFYFNDYRISSTHWPLGVHVALRTLAWEVSQADDFIVLDYTLVNVSGNDLRDVWLGFWIDTTVGNTEHTDPYDNNAVLRWNYYDDKNGAFGAAGYDLPEEFTIEGDQDAWMAWEHDADGEDGLATSWIGYRLLGTEPAVEPAEGERPVNYNQWSYRGVPSQDSWYYEGTDTTTLLPGKYQIMSNGDFDVGETQEENFTREGNWVSLMSTGPFAEWAAGDTLRMTWAVVAGVDSLSLLANALVAQVAYNEGWSIPQGPPSPLLQPATTADGVVLRWAPGDSLDAEGNLRDFDDPLRSPEHHYSVQTGEPDFQGYRIYRYQGEVVRPTPDRPDPKDVATLVAQFDVIDGVGFDTGLPPLNEDGLREFVDTGLLEGFPYVYSVTSFSAPNIQHDLGELESGFPGNDVVLFPGSGPVTGGSPGVGVYPNPYRAASMYDGRVDREFKRRIWFTNLPARCTIKVFTLAGDVVQTIEHDDASTGQHSWDLITTHGRAIASGLYVFAVEDHDTGEVQRGKLVSIK